MDKIRVKEESLNGQEKAEKQYHLALEANPDNAATHYHYGKLLKQMKRYDEAEKQYQLAIELGHKNPKYQGIFGLLFFYEKTKMKISQKPWYASLVIFLIYELAIMRVEFLPFIVHHLTQLQIDYYFENYIDYTRLIAIALFIVAITYLRWLPHIGWKKSDNLHDLIFLWPAALLLLVHLLFILFSDLPPTKSLMILIINTLIIGISEELMFRGILFHGASSSFGIWRAVWITSIIFSVVHVTNGFITENFVASIMQAFFAFVLGFHLAALRVRLGTIIPCVIIHWIWDFLAYLSTYQGWNLILPLELLFLIYSIWLLQNYLPSRYQISRNRIFQVLSSLRR
jgi:membrane protease YdiL (CAAX protease family)